MAAKLPDIDLSLLTSSAQIFSSASTAPNASSTSTSSSFTANNHQNVSYNYTLPQIRALHKQIHLAIDDKKSRLRTQVGGSYRELLGTADAIVRMRSDMDNVQGILSTMGARCGRGVVGGKVNGMARFTGEREGLAVHVDGSGKRDLVGAARAKLLASCVLALSLLLKTNQNQNQAKEGEQLVVAAKVLVLGRLLAATFDEHKPDAHIKGAVASSIQSLNKLRKRFCKSIDKVLETVGETTSRSLVLSALCAYSLANNSGVRDIIRHFLEVRGSAMASVFEVDEPRSTGHVIKGLELYTKTILDVQYLVPVKLPEALIQFKRETLLSDPSLRQMEGLRLDIYERWCSDTIQTYKPSMHHADLDNKQAVNMLTSWYAKGSEVLLAGLEKSLERTTEFKVLTDMRTEVLQLWIRDGGKARGFDPSTMLDRLRQTINAHVMGVLDAKVHKLRLVGSEVAATLGVWRSSGLTLATDDAQQRRLWDVPGGGVGVGGGFALDIDLHHGAGPFAQDVIGRLYGRNDAVARAVTGYKSWASVIDDVEELVEQLKRQRWDNDVDEIEDEETIDQRQQALSRDDPAKLQERLNDALKRAFTDLDAQLADLWSATKVYAERDKSSSSSSGIGSSSGAVAMYFLRILRDIRARLPPLEAIKGFGLEMVPSLQSTLAKSVAIAPVDAFAHNVLVRTTVAGRSLWDGSPELPTSPSPSVFRLLRSLSVAMSDAGMDLWSPAAVAILKQIVGRALSDRWGVALEALLALDQNAEKQTTVREDNETSQISETATEKDEAEDNAVTDKQRKDLLLQWLFDIAILRCSLSVDDLAALEETVCEKAELDDASIRPRLHKSSQEYWKRSSLLFGLLN
ncbi:hypothetical protein BD289DRAFT_363559 [Coniella lustricola]|uniref:Conserved oligomeric Golgi complex subunit 1 n=1 Tax=Coniella lustricola TaxID=2025994 RepID=A0A2T3AF46_9PEZI|nr:hypothetical protein BD289DRAFT_363559 [Coniella lustricola]